MRLPFGLSRFGPFRASLTHPVRRWLPLRPHWRWLPVLGGVYISRTTTQHSAVVHWLCWIIYRTEEA